MDFDELMSEQVEVCAGIASILLASSEPPGLH
jgi:hypothetical protein